MKLILLGPPGSGKGTIAEMLQKKYNWYKLTPGALLRKEIKKKSIIGKKIEKSIQTGKLAPNKIVDDLVKKHLHKNIIFDGYPRSISQAKQLHKFTKINLVVFLHVTQKEIIKRLSKRAQCIEKGESRPIILGKDKCKGKIIKRKDDTPKVIKKRFKIYNEKTKKVLNFFKEKGLIIKIDGQGPPKQVFSKTKKAIETYIKQNKERRVDIL